tara:strand:- start:1156 stop:2415 length:1260 start_codon:yes stop_codon:yes gene_type:complete
MFVPSSSGVALALLFVCMVCWGSWGNVAKWSSLPFPAFYAVFSVGIWFWSAVLGLVLGSNLYPADSDSRDFAANLRSVGIGLPVLFACLAGLLFNLANVGLTLLITLVGLATAFPVCIGTALIVGTLLAYIVEPGQTSLGLLCVGLALAVSPGPAHPKPHQGSLCLLPSPILTSSPDTHFQHSAALRAQVLALLAMAGAHVLKERGDAANESRPKSPREQQDAHHTSATCAELVPTLEAVPLVPSNKLSMRATVLLSLLSGVLMGGFAPLETLAQDGKSYGVDEALIPYTCSFYFCLAAMLSSAPICMLLARHPLSGPAVPSIVAELRRGGVLASAMPFLGGAVWTLGTTLNFVAGKAVASQAVAYSIGQAAPMVAALWGIFYFKEFSGTGPLARLLLSLMFACYVGAVVAIALSSGSV